MCKFLLLVLMAGFSFPAMAQRVDQLPPQGVVAAPFQLGASAGAPSLSDGIAAVVNDSVISISDVKNRIDLSILSAGLPNTAEVREKISVQVVRALITEQLQLQEGKKLGLTVSDEEIAQAMVRLAQDNKIPGGDMAAFLRHNHIPPLALRNQIKAALTWNKFVMHVLRPRVDIGEDEIDAVIARMRSNAGQQEYLVSEIFLPVDDPMEEKKVEALAENLTSQLKEGAVFGAVAQQFSQSAGAGAGGDIGWIQSGQLEPELDRVLKTLQPGEIAGPIRSASGYYVLGVREKRTIAGGDIKEMTVRLQQAFHSYGLSGSKESLLEEANAIRQKIQSCDGLQRELEKGFPGWRWQDLGEVKLASAPPWLAQKVANISEGHASEAMAMNKGALVLFVCGRTMPEGIDRNAVRASIGTERLELLAQRQLRDMRREAFVNVRLKAIP